MFFKNIIFLCIEKFIPKLNYILILYKEFDFTIYHKYFKNKFLLKFLLLILFFINNSIFDTNKQKNNFFMKRELRIIFYFQN